MRRRLPSLGRTSENGLNFTQHAAQSGIASLDCAPYSASRNYSCPFDAFGHSSSGECADSKRVFASNYGYVGGCYECTTEQAIMQEVLLNGPVILAVDVPSSLIHQPLDVFVQKSPSGHHKVCDVEGLTGWEFTAHALAVVGWTKEAWIVRNSWGTAWGVGGYGLLRRGDNVGGSENQVVFVDADMHRGILHR